jgi:hypothetical protein
MAKNNESYGGCAPKSGTHLTPLSRKKGFSETMTSMASKTRSAYKATEMNYEYQSCASHETGARSHRGWNPE